MGAFRQRYPLMTFEVMVVDLLADGGAEMVGIIGFP